MLHIRCSSLEGLNCVRISILFYDGRQVAVQYQQYISIIVQDVIYETLTQFRDVFFIVRYFKSLV